MAKKKLSPPKFQPGTKVILSLDESIREIAGSYHNGFTYMYTFKPSEQSAVRCGEDYLKPAQA